MGCVSSSSAEDPVALARSHAIEKQLAVDRNELKNTIKLLLLGAGESGKSTVMKQLLLLHGEGFSDSERNSYREVIFENTVQSLSAILDALPLLSLELLPSNEGNAAVVEDADTGERREDPALIAAIVSLWRDPAVQAAMQQTSQFQLNDSARYFLDCVERTMAHGYVATDSDIIRARIRTTGIIENRLRIGKLTYRVFDVGGQRSERRKWINCFEGVDVLLFLVAISEYDQRLFEDETVSRMEEAMILFSSICNSRYFSQSTIILFLNKADILRQKLQRSPLKEFYPNYNGPDGDFESACRFFLQEFSGLFTQDKQLYHHFTCATDRAAIQVVLNAVNDTIIQQGLQESGMI